LASALRKADAGFGGNVLVMMQWSGALLVDGLAEALISVRQAWEQRGTNIQFADKCCYVFPDGNTVQFGKDYYQDCIICAPEYKASSVITRGKTIKHSAADIWHARLPVSVSTMQKWRGCIRGDRLIKGVDYDRIFWPTVRWQTVRTVLATAACKKMCVASADVTQAYGCADNPHDWYTFMPKGLRGRPEYIDTDGNEKVYKLGNLYGGPPAGRHCYFEADATLKAYSLEQSTADPCLYTRRTGNGWLYI
jgi:hypothetical protein